MSIIPPAISKKNLPAVEGNKNIKIISLKNDQMQFSYRNSIIRDDQIIIAGVFRGKKKSKKRITEEIKKVEFQKKNLALIVSLKKFKPETRLKYI